MRLFIAIDLPDEVKAHLAAIQAIPEYIARISWVKQDNIHITLKFFGEVKDDARILQALESVTAKPFTATLSQIGVFPSENYVRVIWAGLQDETPVFELHKLIDIALSRQFPMEKQFLGHITIGRVKFVKQKEEFKKMLHERKVESLSFPVNSFKMMKSTLTPEGPLYEVVREFPLS